MGQFGGQSADRQLIEYLVRCIGQLFTPRSDQMPNQSASSHAAPQGRHAGRIGRRRPGIGARHHRIIMGNPDLGYNSGDQ